jgi:Na+-translocating ferredoxin:NAD+ oxidoreductase RnfD subunit
MSTEVSSEGAGRGGADALGSGIDSRTPDSRAAAAAGVNAAAPVAKRRFQLDQRYIAPLFITCVLVGAHFSVGVLESPWKTGLAIATAILAEIVLGRLFYGKIPNLASAYITGISVGILVRSPWYWPYALCSLISITSKYVLRVKGRHIWNPSNFGIAVMLFLAPQTVASLSIQWGNSIGSMIVIWTLGTIIISRVKRFHICATYVISFLALAVVRSLITGHPLAAEVAPITGPMYQLFIFFMITDPKTTVHSRKGQMVVAFLVALVEAILRLFQYVHAPFYALFIVGPAANLLEMWWNSRKAAAPPAAGTAPTAA